MFSSESAKPLYIIHLEDDPWNSQLFRDQMRVLEPPSHITVLSFSHAGIAEQEIQALPPHSVAGVVADVNLEQKKTSLPPILEALNNNPTAPVILHTAYDANPTTTRMKNFLETKFKDTSIQIRPKMSGKTEQLGMVAEQILNLIFPDPSSYTK